MCAAIVIVPLFQRAGFGSVLGYLISGMIIGPFGFGWIHDSENITHLAELGVILLLFVIGLEIQPRKLWAMRTHLYGLGGLQILSTTCVLTAIGLVLGLPMTGAIVVSFALSLSSTAFALQTLKERNQFNTEFGRSSFAILLAQDLAAIPALAIIPALGAKVIVDHSPHPMWLSTLLGLAVIVGLIVGSRFVFRPIFRMIAQTHNREIFTATTLFIVLGVAALMQGVGLSAALGTFIAGVLLAESEYRHEIEADLEPFKSLLLGLFFISVGMSVRLPLLLESPAILIFGTLAYMTIKFSAIYFVGRIFKQNHETAKLMAITIAQGGEFAFVIFGLVNRLSIAPKEFLDQLTVVITLSMALSPLLYLAHDFVSRRRNKKAEAVYDQIKDESPEVIIAGFGRVGQVFARMLRAQGIPFVAIEHDSEQIELVRRFGNKVYYGDATRRDILEAAGVEKAKYFVLAISDLEVSLTASKILKESYPHIKIFARARNRGHVFDLLDLGVHRIKRETFEASLIFAGELLTDMGYPAEKVATIVERFRIHDETMLLEQHKVRHDDKTLISVSRQGAAQLAQVLGEDSEKTYIAPSPEGPRA